MNGYTQKPNRNRIKGTASDSSLASSFSDLRLRDIAWITVGGLIAYLMTLI
ncbi:MAG: hypothetical protein KDB27_25815 [Planctomycetales bacterium]|nr:hypothetical protein [Planctomycetales bacterium]